MRNFRQLILIPLLFIFAFANIDSDSALSTHKLIAEQDYISHSFDQGTDLDSDMLTSFRTPQVLKKFLHIDKFFTASLMNIKDKVDIFVPTFQVKVRCALKSYLHLFQLF